MKIQRFNESYQADKIIKKYNNSILLEYYIDEEQLAKSKENILNLINEYIDLNKDYFNKKYGYNFSSKMKYFNFYIDEDNGRPVFGISSRDSYDIIWLKYKDINEILDFFSDPDILRNHKKFNI